MFCHIYIYIYYSWITHVPTNGHIIVSVFTLWYSYLLFLFEYHFSPVKVLVHKLLCIKLLKILQYSVVFMS